MLKNRLTIVSYTRCAKEIYKNISGLRNYPQAGEAAQGALELGAYKNIAKTRYTNDKQITDHYAIIPTGQGLGTLKGVFPEASAILFFAKEFAAIFRYPSLSKTLKEEKKDSFSIFVTRLTF